MSACVFVVLSVLLKFNFTPSGKLSPRVRCPSCFIRIVTSLLTRGTSPAHLREKQTSCVPQPSLNPSRWLLPQQTVRNSTDHVCHAADLFLESKPSVLPEGGNVDPATKWFSPNQSYMVTLHSSAPVAFWDGCTAGLKLQVEW